MFFNRHYELLFTIFILLGISTEMYATHNRAGEIIIDQIGNLRIRATIVTYTVASSILADRDTLEINWGDGTSTKVPRSNGNGKGVLIGNNTKYNLYVAEHTYGARSTYTISMTDRNRNGDILNVDPPYSINVPFHIETTYKFLSPQFQGYNNSPRLLQPPIDFACKNRLFIHNPNAYDPDGDSISYELIIPKQSVNENVPNYSFPQQIEPGPDNMVRLNNVTGDFVWDSPKRTGEYNIAFYIHEYRGGELINSTIRDMQILVEDCNNSPPKVIAEDEECVIAGTEFQMPLQISDPDFPKQQVLLEGYGGPFELMVNPATLSVNPEYMDQPFDAVFQWKPDCNNIRKNPYSIIFRAVDDFQGNTGLSYLKSVRIKIVGPPPTNLEITNQSNQSRLTWDTDYICKDARDGYFKGFVIWRKEGCIDTEIDTCFSGLASLGYEIIARNITEINNNKYIYNDDSFEKGRSYCYRVTAEFAQSTLAGNTFNNVMSLPSNEECIRLAGNTPLLTKVSVEETSETNGMVRIEYRKPFLTDFDTIAHPGPYTFEIQRAIDDSNRNFLPISASRVTYSSFADINIGSFDDSGLNTEQNAYVYRIAFYTEGNTTDIYTFSADGSTIHSSLIATDRSTILSWEEDVPWYNEKYYIFRKTEMDTEFTLIDSTNQSTYTDIGLTNDVKYCYYISSVGKYCSVFIDTIIVNKSNIICGIPIDTIPPCTPFVSIINPCNSINTPGNPVEYINELKWTINQSECPQGNDIAYFDIYFSGDSTQFEKIGTVDFAEKYVYFHQPDFGIAGCYYITAIDHKGNESKPSVIQCLKNCPEYELPNTFTPNGDGQNDKFIPRRIQFIEEVDFTVFNQWGNKIYETSDPLLNWDGTTLSRKQVDEGTYFYTIIIYDTSLGKKSVFDTRKGYIEIIR